MGGLEANRARQKAKPRIVFSEHTDQEGATVFRHACKYAVPDIDDRDWPFPRLPRLFRRRQESDYEAVL